MPVGGCSFLQIRGAGQLADVSKALRRAGEKDLRNEMTRGLRRSAKPLIVDARDHALDTLPSHGGLGKRVARSRFRVSVRGSGQRAGVRISAAGVDRRVDTQGRLWKPVFGRRRPGAIQQVPKGWFTQPMEAGAPKVRREMLAAIAKVAKRVEGA